MFIQLQYKSCACLLGHFMAKCIPHHITYQKQKNVQILNHIITIMLNICIKMPLNNVYKKPNTEHKIHFYRAPHMLYIRETMSKQCQ